MDPRVHFQDELAVDSAGVKHAVDLAELHSCAAPTRPFASARASETVSPSSAKGPPTAFSFSVLLCRVQWERGRRKGFSPILIPFHGSFPKGVSSLYLRQKQNKTKVLLEEVLPEEGRNREAALSSHLRGGKAREIPDARGQVIQTSHVSAAFHCSCQGSGLDG